MNIIDWLIVWIESIWVDSVALLLILTTETFSDSLRSSSNSTWCSSGSISNGMSLSVRNAAANASRYKNNGNHSTNSYNQSKESDFEITNFESTSIKPFTCWYNFVIPILSFFTCFRGKFDCGWNVFQLVSCCSCNPLGSNSELTHVIFFNWIRFIDCLWCETDKSILCHWNIEFLTEFSLID